MNWWEKTVEYLFVKKYLPQVADKPNSYVAPLDGDHGIIGDVVFSRHTQWVLVEFKRNDSSLSSDNDKFPNYNRAKDALKDQDSLHFFVYGTASPDSGLILEACTYFSRKQVNIDTLIEGGVPYPAFSQYVADFVRLRKRGGDGGFTTSFSPSTDPRSGGGAFLDYSTVLGIIDGKITHSMSLGEFRALGNPPRAPWLRNGPVNPLQPSGKEIQMPVAVKVPVEYE
ncbi:hypothetical protein YA0697_06025 [Pseudomonas viridiflava]|uniref:hypothetical protein n=1 Tax=Pseudomonas viridiflava TaxID=33069 RepID=UPI0018E5EC80|nr:hypothetical protein [Pseudomonas viridiflava]MBI6681266.1 hypothetical protein [Pseudomonas viridiflava]